MKPLEPIVPGAPPAGHYSPAIVAGDTIYVSGQLPSRADGTHDPAAPFEVQVERVLDKLIALVVQAGGSVETIARVNVYLVGAARWDEFNTVYARKLGAHRPARSVVPVSELHFGYLIEVDAVALRR